MIVSMGSVCCVAAREGTTLNGPHIEVSHRNARNSPSWSFRWDNRGRVAGEEASVSWYSNGLSRNDMLESKSETIVETAHASETASPAGNSQSLTWKSPLSEQASVKRRTRLADSSIPRSVSMEVKASKENQFPQESDRSPVKLSPVKLSPVMSSTASLSTSPLSSQSPMFPASLTPSRFSHHSRKSPLLRQASDSRNPALKSPSNYSTFEERPPPNLPQWSNDSNSVSHGRLSDGWSIHGFPEYMPPSYRERWSFDSESFGNRDKFTRSSSQISASPSGDLQTCGLCSKLLSENSSFGCQKIVVTTTSHLSVVSVLMCGHVYHAECLESLTPEISKYDPACPVCTLGEKQIMKLSEKVLKAEMDSKARKRLKNCGVDGDLDVYDRKRSSRHERKISFGKPFLRRHFSFGSKSSKSFAESNNSTRKKSLFWTKSSRQ